MCFIILHLSHIVKQQQLNEKVENEQVNILSYIIHVNVNLQN